MARTRPSIASTLRTAAATLVAFESFKNITPRIVATGSRTCSIPG